MFSCLFSFLMKSREEHVNIFNKSMFIPISRHPTSHVTFSASLVRPEPLFTPIGQEMPVSEANSGAHFRYNFPIPFFRQIAAPAAVRIRRRAISTGSGPLAIRAQRYYPTTEADSSTFFHFRQQPYSATFGSSRIHTPYGGKEVSCSRTAPDSRSFSVVFSCTGAGSPE